MAVGGSGSAEPSECAPRRSASPAGPLPRACTNAPFSRIVAVRRVPKTLAAALVALVLAVGVVACGGGDDSDSTATEAAGQRQSQADDASQGENQSNESGSGKGDSSSDSDGEGQSSGGDASDFVPKRHSDSGGGAEKFKVKGGDNSVQEFGQEADTAEFDAAAVALHNFLDARAESNWAAACQYMSSSVIESFEKLAAQAKGVDDTSCGAILEALTNPAAKQSMKEEAAKANVGSLRIEDEQAFVIYTGIDGTIMAMPMVNEDGTWKVGSLAGTPLS